jgi:hypothetical protein
MAAFQERLPIPSTVIIIIIIIIKPLPSKEVRIKLSTLVFGDQKTKESY